MIATPLVGNFRNVKIRVLELGSNSFQLHGFHVSSGGIVRRRWGHKRTVRLAEGLRDGQLAGEYARRGIEAVEQLLADSPEQWPLIAIATSAVREAQNRNLLLGPLANRFGIVPRVLSGQDEARTAFAGALASIESDLGRVAVVDIGGGSTEVALGDRRVVEFVHSARVGTLLRERALPTFERELQPVLRALSPRRPDHVIFASGSARALRRLLVAQGLLQPGSSIPLLLLERIVPVLPGISPSELSRYGVGLERQATLPTGALLVLAAAKALGASCVEVAEGGLREGAALAEWRVQQSLRSIERLGADRVSVERLAAHFARLGAPAELPVRLAPTGS
jgi:exopolyphosphatase/guanosine-5'-triphosphate,3'-diphosphate pyrophosphatase